jgi:serine/threonine protein kinase
MSLSAGTRLGPYEILTLLGAGGMGEVYRATDTNLKRAVALKVLPTVVSEDMDRLARFQREAEVLASLNHPHIGAIYGLERSGSMTALVMELVEGPTLADRLTQGALPLMKPLRWQSRSLRPSRSRTIRASSIETSSPRTSKCEPTAREGTRLRPGKNARPRGSGRASSAHAFAHHHVPSDDARGCDPGTAAYMSPEQAAGNPAGKRADVAFGVVLFEMLTGRGTFTGETVTDVLAAVLRAEPDWSLLPADTPAAIRRPLRRCLEKNPVCAFAISAMRGWIWTMRSAEVTRAAP